MHACMHACMYVCMYVCTYVCIVCNVSIVGKTCTAIVIVLYFIALYGMVWYCIGLHCIVLYCTVLYCTVLYCIVLHCIALHCIVLYCIVCLCMNIYLNVAECHRAPASFLRLARPVSLHCVAAHGAMLEVTSTGIWGMHDPKGSST